MWHDNETTVDYLNFGVVADACANLLQQPDGAPDFHRHLRWLGRRKVLAREDGFWQKSFQGTEYFRRAMALLRNCTVCQSCLGACR